MFKQLCLLTRRPGMPMEDFIDTYENGHAKLMAPMMPLARRYLRRYVTPEMNAVSQSVPEVGFDCLTEIWWDSRADFEAGIAALRADGRYEQIREDEKSLFAGPSSPVFSVDERESRMRGFVDRPALGGVRMCDGTDDVFKLVFLLKRRPDMMLEDYLHHYETRHRVLGEKAMTSALRYVRRHVVPEGNLSSEVRELPFDTVMEIWWESRAGFASPDNRMDQDMWEEIVADEERFFATHANPVFSVREADSPMRGW